MESLTQTHEEVIGGKLRTLPCVITDLDIKDYHNKNCVGVSKSDLDLISRSPKHYVMGKIEEKEETEAMLIGSVFHCMVLEPTKFSERYYVASDIEKRTKEGKEKWAKEEEERNGRTLVKKSQFETAMAMKLSLLNSKTFKRLIDGAVIESSAFSIDEETRVIKKCRPDIAKPIDRILVDLKSCNDASANEFRKQIVNYNYDKQAAYYLNTYSEATGIKFDTFIFVCVEKVAPYGVGIYMINDACLEVGEKLFRRDLETYAREFSVKKRIEEVNCYPDMIQPIDMATFGFDLGSR